MSQLTINHIISNDDMGGASEQDARTWATYVEKRLAERFPDADIRVSVNNRQSGMTNIDGECDEIDAAREFIGRLWDSEQSIAFPA